MKKYFMVVLLAVLVLSGCVDKNEKNDANGPKQQNQETTLKENEKIILKEVDNIKSWKHPVKEYFETKNLNIEKVEFADDKSYYVFKFESLDETYLTNRKFLKRIAEEIAYRDYKIVAGESFAEVKCDKIQGIVKSVATDFANIEFIEKKKPAEKITEKNKAENKEVKNVEKNLTEKQKKAITLAEAFAKKNLHECGYSEGITNMSVSSEEDNEIVLKVWNKGSSINETIDWLIVDLKSCKVTSENFSN